MFPKIVTLRVSPFRVRTLLLILGMLFSAALLVTRSQVSSAPDNPPSFSASQTYKQESGTEQQRVTDQYGKLPIAFEANEGQLTSEAHFIARGRGYALFLTSSGSLLNLRASGEQQSSSVAKEVRRQTALSMQLKNAQATQIVGEDKLPGKVNYFTGSDPTQWRTNVSTFGRVRYESVYPGIDLVYYGNQQELEYDFNVAPGGDPSVIRLVVEGARRIRLNARGDLLLSSDGGVVTLRKPVSYQYLNGKKRIVRTRYILISRNEVAFRLGSYDKSLPLVIDPVLIYSTYLGGSLDEEGNSITVDPSGSAYITGSTASPEFPVVNPLQSQKGNSSDIFITKLNPQGSAILYSTFLGGSGSEVATGIALDSSGSVYVAGQTSSSDFPLVNPLQSTLGITFDAFVAKLSSSGSTLVYSTYLGGRSSEIANAIAVDASGNATVTGSTFSRDFPLANAIQAQRSGNALFRTDNGAANWTPSDVGILAGAVFNVAFDPSNALVVYAACENGIFKTSDGGITWSALPQGQTTTTINQVVVDPTNPSILYAATNSGMLKSTDGGNNFVAINNGLNPAFARTLAIDPVNPNILYLTAFGGVVFRTNNGGASWTGAAIPNVVSIPALAVDPNTPATLYAGTNRGVYKSTDGGVAWSPVNGIPLASINALAIDKTTNSVYATGTPGIFRSTDGGANWLLITTGAPFSSVSRIALDPTNSSVIYAASPSFGLFKTVNGGATWSSIISGFPNTTVNSLVVDPFAPVRLYVGTISGPDVFVTKLNSSGNSLIYSTYLGGILSDSGNGVAVDGAGNAYITGSTSSSTFPTMNALQPLKSGSSDAFVLKISTTGSALIYSTFLGGDAFESGNGIAIDGNGNAYVTGSTSSTDFPTLNAFQNNPGSNFVNDGFVAKLTSSGSALVYSSYLGGSADDQCFAIAVDAAGQAVVTGSTLSTNFPVLRAQQPTKSGAFLSDAFVTKIGANGSALVSSTYLGGSASDFGLGIAVDAAGAMYVVGMTSSDDFPTVNPLQNRNGSMDAFVAKLVLSPELSVTISDSPDPVQLGSNLTYTVNVKNLGELPATGVSLTLTLPAGATIVSLNTSGGSCSGSGPINCGLGTLNADEMIVISLVIKPPSTRSISTTATVSANEPDPISSNNTATAETLIDFADLSITKKVPAERVMPGSNVTYALAVTNKGVIAATGVMVTDALPNTVSFISCTVTGGVNCVHQNGVVSVSFSSLAVNAAEVALLTVQINNGIAPGTVVNNTASITAQLPDPDTTNNSSSRAITITTNPIVPKSNGIVAFASDRAFTPVSEPSGIYKVNLDGMGEMLFPNIPLNAGFPSWSADGGRLAYRHTNHSGNEPVEELFTINADGTGKLKIAANLSHFNTNISWSPSGDQVAYIGQGPFGTLIRSIFIANTDGSGSFPLPNSPTFISTVDWSPTGDKFVYGDDSEIYVMNLDGTQQTKLTTSQQTPDGPTFDKHPQWSPDGSKILFTRSTNNFHDLYLMNSDGSGQTKLFNVPSQNGEWSPDGQAVVFELLNAIYRVNLDGSNLQQLTANIYYNFDPTWQAVPNPNPTPTPTPSPTFLLSGRLTTDGGTPLTFAGIQLTGPINVTIFPNSSGDYAFIRLLPGQYTVTPASSAHTFTPASRSITISNANVTGVDFVGTFVPANITGRVTDDAGQPLAGIKVTSTGGFPQGDTVTNSNGEYAFNNVQRNRTYSIFCDPFGLYVFEPDAKILSNLQGSEVVNFVGTLKPANRITGRVVETISNQGIAGIQLNLTQDGTAAGSTVTDATGNFTFGPRKANHQYTVSIPSHQTYIFEPLVSAPTPFAQIVIQNLTTDQNVTFTGARRNTVQFAVANTSVAEGAIEGQILVTRSGDTASAATINFATIDDPAAIRCDVINGTAYARCDYVTKVDVISFAAGETTKSFKVSLVDDGFAEGNETFKIMLNNSVGATLGAQIVTTVTINDNDTTNGANPIFSAPFFVRQHYLDFLSREPEPAGNTSWINLLNNCSDVNNNPTCDRITVSGAFFGSQEFQLKGYFVFRFYRLAFNRLPTYAELIPDMSAVTGQTPIEVFQKKAAFVNTFSARPEFVSAYGSMTNDQYVNALMGRFGLTQITTPHPQNPDGTNKVTMTTSDLVSILNPGPGMLTRQQVLRAIADSDQVFNLEFNRAFVAMQYYGYLRRTPETAGFNAWLNYLNANPTDFRTMVNGFMNSVEYRLRFGPSN